MTTYKKSYVFTHEDATEFITKYNLVLRSEQNNIVDYYLSPTLRIRYGLLDKDNQCVLTQKAGYKPKERRKPKKTIISSDTADILKEQNIKLKIKQRISVLEHDKHSEYTFSMYWVNSPLKIAVFNIEKIIDDKKYDISHNITQDLFGVQLVECPVPSYYYHKRKIGICGAASAGKTETAKIISYKLNTELNANSFHVTEFATSFIQKYKKKPNRENQFIILHGQMLREQNANLANIIISDCPTFLCYIYFLHYNQERANSDTALFSSKLYKCVLFDSLSYDNIIFLKIKEYKDNNIRFQSKNEAQIIENKIYQFLTDHNITFIESTYDNVDKMINSILYLNKKF